MSHEDKAFFGSFIGVLAALVVVAFIFYFIADIVSSGSDDEEANARLQAKIEDNIRPVGKVHVGSAPAAGAQATAAAQARSGEQVYNTACMACHSVGVAGAPKTGDKAAWSARVDKGIDGLLATAISGINAMPPKGTCGDCSDAELKAAIEYILTQSGY